MSDIEIDVLNSQTPEIDIESSTEAIPELEGVALYGPQGPKGDKGDKGEQGIQGIQGIQGETGETGATGNGIVGLEKTGTSGLVDTYTLTYTNGDSDDITVTNGKDGQNGQDGFSPIATVEPIQDGAKITITDKDGTTTTNLYNGTDGTNGQDGAAATITVGTVTTGSAGTNASVTNSGTTSAAVFDFVIPRGDKGDTGNTGATGQDGFSPSASVSQSGDVTTITITDKNGTTTESIDLSNYATQTDLTNGLATKQDTLIAGTDLEIVNATTPKLPTGYTELEWLQSDGACCIDLGVISYGNDEVEQKFQRPSTLESSVDSWFGSIQNSAAVPRFSIGASSSSGIFAGFNFTKPLAEYDNNIHIISLKKVSSTYYASIDGVTASYVPSSASTNPSINSYLFARNSSTITYDGTGTRIFYHKQNRYDGTPLLDLVPAKRDSDNALGMYDLVSNAFLGNSGTGTFTGGPEVIYPTTTTINFTNASGYTTNVGTVTSVNGNQPDANGNVTIQAGSSTDVQINSTSITSQGVANIVTNTAYNASSNKIATMSDIPAAGANTDLSNLSATGEAHFQAPLVSGTNIKTINNTSILGSGNIDTSEIFVATYGTTTYNEIKTAITNGKIVLAKAYNLYYSLTLNSSTVYAFSYFLSDACYIVEVTNGNLWSNGSYTYQQTSTAVTHTANTAVGNSTTPVYIASNGTATSTGLSIASSRFDGQWVAKEKELSTSTAINSYTLDLSTYLPNTTSTYDVMVAFTISSKATSVCNAKIYSDKISITPAYMRQKTSSTSHSIFNSMLLIIPVQRYLYFSITNQAADSTNITAVAYRRIGTNT